MGYNVNFIGRLGVDSETVTTGTTQFISFRVAVDDSVGKESSTRWVKVSADANKFKNMAQYLKKGKLVHITGSDRVSAYAAKNGELGVDTKVWADKIEFIPIGNKTSEDGEATATNTTQDEKNAQMAIKIPKSKANSVTVVDIPENSDDDLPF